MLKYHESQLKNEIQAKTAQNTEMFPLITTHPLTRGSPFSPKAKVCSTTNLLPAEASVQPIQKLCSCCEEQLPTKGAAQTANRKEEDYVAACFIVFAAQKVVKKMLQPSFKWNISEGNHSHTRSMSLRNSLCCPR